MPEISYRSNTIINNETDKIIENYDEEELEDQELIFHLYIKKIKLK